MELKEKIKTQFMIMGLLLIFFSMSRIVAENTGIILVHPVLAEVGIFVSGLSALVLAIKYRSVSKNEKVERPETIKKELEKWKKNQLPKVIKRRAIVLLISSILLGILGTFWVFSIGTYYSNLFLLFAVAALISTAISFGGLMFYKFEK